MKHRISIIILSLIISRGLMAQAGKNVGLIVSSWSGGISSVVADCKHLVPNGYYFSENLWINHSNHSRRSTLISDWLAAINYNTITGINSVKTNVEGRPVLYNLRGQRISSIPTHGIYIENGVKKKR